jgi:hypothetical protein
MRRYQDKQLKRFDEAYSRMLEAEAGNPAEVIKQGIDAPFVNAKQSNLGSTPFYGIYVSLDPQEEWANQIYQNSRHFTFGWDGEKLELLTKHHKIPLKLRKTKAADAETVVAKINKYIQAAVQSMEESSMEEVDGDLQRQALARRGTQTREFDPQEGPHEGFDEKPGLEGPFRSKTGHIYYYDMHAGQYYDPKRDMYIDNTELADYGIF